MRNLLSTILKNIFTVRLFRKILKCSGIFQLLFWDKLYLYSLHAEEIIF